MKQKIKRKPKERMVEIARSFSYKLNVGNYESRDFFCSQKAECRASESEKISEALYQFCKSEVVKAVNDYMNPHVADKKKSADQGHDAAEHDAGNN